MILSGTYICTINGLLWLKLTQVNDVCFSLNQPNVQIEDVINVIGEFHLSGSAWMIHINAQNTNVIILHPDNLIPVHTISGAAYCRRKAVLDAFTSSFGRPSLESPHNISGTDFKILKKQHHSCCHSEMPTRVLLGPRLDFRQDF
jgi:hypothetical protein